MTRKRARPVSVQVIGDTVPTDNREQLTPTVACELCAAPLKRKRPNQVFCSAECRREMERRRREWDQRADEARLLEERARQALAPSPRGKAPRRAAQLRAKAASIRSVLGARP